MYNQVMRDANRPTPDNRGQADAASPAAGAPAVGTCDGLPAASPAAALANEPFCWLDGSNTLVVFIHGYLGSPDSFRSLAGRLKQQGMDCAALRLPGHGGSAREFTRADERDWIRHVHREIDRMRLGYQHTILVGHSLGSLLALDYAADHAGDRPVDGLILFCTPLHLRLRPFSLKIALALYLIPPRRDNPVAAAYRLSYGLRRPLLNPLALLRPTVALIRIIRTTREKLTRVSAPTLIIQSHQDETASPKSACDIASRLGGYVHVHWLQRSRHAWIHADEQPLIDVEIDRLLETARSRCQV